MKYRKTLFAVLALLALTGCGNDSGVSKPSSDSASSNETVTYTNQKTTYEKLVFEDFLKDYQSQTEEDFPSYEPIDLSSKTSTFSISEGGTYLLTGSNDDLTISIETKDAVRLILSGVSLASKSGPCIEVVKASSFEIYLASHTKNYLSDTENNTSDGALQVKKCNLSLLGKGYLFLAGNGKEENGFGNGIYCSKEISIEDCHLRIEANDHGINGKGGVTTKNCYLSLDSQGDGIHSKDAGLTMSSTTLLSKTLGDGIDTSTAISIEKSQLSIETEGTFLLYSASEDSDGSLYEESRYILKDGEYHKVGKDEMDRYPTRYYLKEKCKGIKSDSTITLKDNEIDISSADDAINSDTDILIESGKLSIHTKDQGINATDNVIIGKEDVTEQNDDFTISVFSSYEGIQGGNITFYDGYTYLIAEDDGINASSDNLENPTMNFKGDALVYVNAEGDGIDSNGSITMESGTLIIFGPTSGGNYSLDSDKTFSFTGGKLFAFSYPDMIELPTTEKNLVSATISDTIKEDELLTIDGENLSYSFLMAKEYSKLSFVSISDYTTDETYSIRKGGTTDSLFIDSVSLSSSVSSAETIYEFTITSSLTSLGSQTGNGKPGDGNGRPGGRP